MICVWVLTDDWCEEHLLICENRLLNAKSKICLNDSEVIVICDDIEVTAINCKTINDNAEITEVQVNNTSIIFLSFKLQSSFFSFTAHFLIKFF